MPIAQPSTSKDIILVAAEPLGNHQRETGLHGSRRLIPQSSMAACAMAPVRDTERARKSGTGIGTIDGKACKHYGSLRLSEPAQASLFSHAFMQQLHHTHQLAEENKQQHQHQHQQYQQCVPRSP